jgi:hypothetical protein
MTISPLTRHGQKVCRSGGQGEWAVAGAPMLPKMPGGTAWGRRFARATPGLWGNSNHHGVVTLTVAVPPRLGAGDKALDGPRATAAAVRFL